jgi:phosphoribosyl 1,2-cyclic phosphodiesterase
VTIGGNTSCVAVTPTGADRPSLLLDAGTGIRSVTALIAPHAFAGTILLTHLHWDHVQGLPFFAAGDRDGSSVRLLLPDGGDDAESALARAMSPPHFPIGPDGLRGDWAFGTIAEGGHHIEGLDVLAREIPHKGGRTFGYRLTDASGSVAYLPDHDPAPHGAAREAALALADGVDALVHGGQFVASEAAIAHDYGHAVVDDVVAFATEAGAGRLILTHHAPGRTDAEVAAIVRALSSAAVPVIAASEGLALEVEATARVR